MDKLLGIKNRIKGPVFSIITPFRASDDEIDYEALGNYIDLIFRGGGNIFFVMGYNSRFSELSWDEIKKLNRFVTERVKQLDIRNIMIVADPLHCSTKVSASFAVHAQEIGADLISIICREKFYSEDQIYSHYATVAEATEIGILVHEMPFLSGYGGPPVNWPISLLDRIANIPNVIAIKEDAKDDDYSRQVIETIRDRVAIIISGGGQRQWLQFADIGCHAWLNGIGVFEPRLATIFWSHYCSGKLDLCHEIINKIEMPFFEKVVDKYGWHLAIKAVLEARNIMPRHERLPLQALNQKQFGEIVQLMNSLPLGEVLQN